MTINRFQRLWITLVSTPGPKNSVKSNNMQFNVVSTSNTTIPKTAAVSYRLVSSNDLNGIRNSKKKGIQNKNTNEINSYQLEHCKNHRIFFAG